MERNRNLTIILHLLRCVRVKAVRYVYTLHLCTKYLLFLGKTRYVCLQLGKGFGCAYKWTLEECPVNNFRDEAIKVIKDGGAMSIRISEILFRSGLNFFANVTGEWHFRIVIRKKVKIYF